jgi:hypothetical protein
MSEKRDVSRIAMSQSFFPRSFRQTSPDSCAPGRLPNLDGRFFAKMASTKMFRPVVFACIALTASGFQIAPVPHTLTSTSRTVIPVMSQFNYESLMDSFMAKIRDQRGPAGSQFETPPAPQFLRSHAETLDTLNTLYMLNTLKIRVAKRGTDQSAYLEQLAVKTPKRWLFFRRAPASDSVGI